MMKRMKISPIAIEIGNLQPRPGEREKVDTGQRQAAVTPRC